MEKLQAMVGYKLFKELEDNTIELIRIVHVQKYKDGKNPVEITIRDEGTQEVKKMRVENLKDYTPLEPDGLLTFNIVNIHNNGKIDKDVVVTGSKFLNLKIGDTLPFAVCRQSITDIFYNLLINDEKDMMVGLAVNRNDCPSNFDFKLMLVADSIVYSEHINFYRTDVLEDILKMVKVSKFDEVLSSLYKTHAMHVGDPTLLFKKHDKGWCKDLRTLLKENNFQNDINEMLGITDVEFKISDYLEEKILPGSDNETYMSPSDDMIAWLSSVFKLNINNATAVEFFHDINLADFNNSKYLILRDSDLKLYLIVFTEDGEYLEDDLKKESEKKDFSTEFRIKFYNKYNHINTQN